MAAMNKQTSLRPPLPDKRPVELVHHGVTRQDDYFWMNDRDDPEVLVHLEAENRYASAILESVDGLRNTLIEEMRSRIPPDDSSAPYRDGSYFYYYRYEPEAEYPLYCRRKDSPDAPEEVLLDANRLAEGHDFFALRGFSVSPDHSRAAFGIDTVGNRMYTIRFLEFATDEFLPDEIPAVTANIEWAADSRTILYARQHRETLRTYQILRYRLGGGCDLVYQEDDPAFWLGVEQSLSGMHLFLVSDSTLSSEVRYLKSSAPDAEPVLFLERAADHEYYVTDGEDRFFILSNRDAVNFRLFECSIDDTAMGAWQEVIAHRDNVFIDSMDVFADHLVLNIAENGLDQIEIVSRQSGDRSRIRFEEPAYTACTLDNYEYRTGSLRFGFESLVTPESIYDYDFATGQRELVKQEKIPGGYRPDDYVSERRLVEVRDGTRVPVSILYRKDLALDGSAPLLVYGYGSYGISMQPDFDSDLLSLIDRGFVYALVHVRGGAELGRPWYYAGRRKEKMNTFLDFIDVTRFLQRQGYSSPAGTYASGGSAGGLLMGAVVNMAPGLFNGVCARVPFVDVVTTMLDESIPLTTGEFDEWGNPAERASYRYMLGYSPYDNVRPQPYPNLLVITALHDTQVQYWEPAKWVAKLRDLKTDDNLVLLHTDMAAGHSGKTGRYRSLGDTALEYAFFLMLERERRSGSGAAAGD